MNYVDGKVTEIILANGDVTIIKNILCEIYVESQMDSSVRNDFEKALEE